MPKEVVFLFSKSHIMGIMQPEYDVICIGKMAFASAKAVSFFFLICWQLQRKIFRMDEQQSLSHLVLTVTSEKLLLFTTVLQSGIEIMTPAGTSLGQFLSALPGFSTDYLASAVQTIFHNGNAVDDLTTPLHGEKPVLALSSAMPGLAGAIFRKNSFHAALRSDIQSTQADAPSGTPLTVTLKLFNTIALERGSELLRLGVCLPATTLSSFFRIRPGLLQAIVRAELDTKRIDLSTLHSALSRPGNICLRIHDEGAHNND